MIRVPTRQQLHTHPIRTPRLLLRPLDEQDAAEFHQAVEESADTLTPWLPWVAFQRDLQAARKLVRASARDWDRNLAYRLAIFPNAGGRLLGVVGLEVIRVMHARAEMGYWLRKDAQGHGFMTEAAHELLSVAFDQWEFHRIGVAAATSNHQSLAVIARLGFRFEGIAREAEFCAGRWLDHAKFALLARDMTRP